MDIGSLGSDEIIIQMIKERLLEDDCKEGFLLDGFPRTITQAESLDNLLEQMSISLDHIINIDVPDEDIINRISKDFHVLIVGRYTIYYIKCQKK